MFSSWFERQKLRKNLQEQKLSELKDAFSKAFEVYRKNMWASLNDKNTISSRLLGEYQENDVNHIFLWGIYSKILESFPINSEILDNGIKVHMMYFFVKQENMKINKAKIRVNELEKIKKSGNYMIANLIKFGKASAYSESDDFLIMCHCAFSNKKYFDANDQSGPWDYAISESMKRSGVFSEEK